MHVCMCVDISSGSEAMVEVVDGWLTKYYPKTPTWRETADVVDVVTVAWLTPSDRSMSQVKLSRN